MSLKKKRFGDKEVDKKEFYSSKQAISVDSVDLDKIVVSNKWKIKETTYKYLYVFMLYLCVILPQMHGYIKYFDDGGKIWHLLLIMKKFTISITKYGK